MTNLSKDIIKENYDVLIQYQSLFFKGSLNLPDFVMSQSGRIHFEEVKRIFEWIQMTMIVSGSLSFLMIYQNVKNNRYCQYRNRQQHNQSINRMFHQIMFECE